MKYRLIELTLQLRLERLLWQAVSATFFRLTPNTAFAYRRIILNLFGASVKSGARVYPTSKIWLPRNLEMDKNACLGPYVNCYNVEKVILQENCVISQFSTLCTASHDFNNPRFPLIAAPIVVKPRVWVGANCILLPGITLDNGSVIGIGSVVTKNIPNWTVWAGNPAKKISIRQHIN